MSDPIDLDALDRLHAKTTPGPSLDDAHGWWDYAHSARALVAAYPALAARIRHLERIHKMPSFGPDDPLNFMCDPVSVENEKLKVRIRELEAELAAVRAEYLKHVLEQVGE